jgi:D-tyrosyl-tRNA(Tyr) deacylase
VKYARVTVEGTVTGQIDQGLLVLLGIGPADDRATLEKLLTKVLNLRIFSDEAGKMNLNVQQVGGGVLLVSQFTLYGDARKGNRPSFTGAAPPEVARPLYEYGLEWLRTQALAQVGAGVFGADMQVELLNNGPVTIWLDTAEG